MSQNVIDRRQPQRRLTVREALERLSQRLAWYGPETLRVGRIITAGETLLMAEIVSAAGKVVRQLEVDRSTGEMRLVNGSTRIALAINPLETDRGGAMRHLMLCELSLAETANDNVLNSHAYV